MESIIDNLQNQNHTKIWIYHFIYLNFDGLAELLQMTVLLQLTRR